jgi:two-component system, NtrC family, sensor kinase
MNTETHNAASAITAGKRSRQRDVNILVAVILIALLGFLFNKTRGIDFDEHNEIIGNLRQLKQIDAEWNIDVFKSKMGINNNYDPVAQPLPLIRELQVGLTQKTSQSVDSSELLVMLKTFQEAMTNKIALIERFKSQNSIYRNSTNFLPTSADEVVNVAKRAGLSGAKLAELEAAVSGVFSQTLTYNLTPDTTLKEKIAQEVVALKLKNDQYPLEVKEAFDVLLAHVGTTLQQQEVGANLLNELSALPTSKRVDELNDAYAKSHEQRLLDQQFYRQLLIAYSLFLLILLAYLAWRLIRSFRQLGNANSALRKANVDLQESQIQLVQSEKMSALGQMVAGIAHEINTPLAYVKGTLDVMKEHLGKAHDLANSSHRFAVSLRDKNADRQVLNSQYLQVAALSRDVVENKRFEELDSMLNDGSHGIGQISEIVLNLKNFSRLDRANVANFDVRKGLDSTLMLAKNLLKNHVKVETEYFDVPEIMCSPSQINQVFLNIITNAAHAMGEKGTLILRAERHGEDSVRVEIQDDGGGIPAASLPKIFDPFFTTKPIGEGTGMGLSISYKIVEAHGGKILVDTEPGIGTTFSIVLPIAQTRQAPTFIDDDETELQLA